MYFIISEQKMIRPEWMKHDFKDQKRLQTDPIFAPLPEKKNESCVDKAQTWRALDVCNNNW